MIGSYSPGLVALSIIVAILASYVAFALAGRVSSTHGWASAYWLAGGAVALGTGIWAMHFIGMLAYHLSIPMAYDTGLTGASLLIAIVVSGFAMYVVSARALTWRWLAVAGTIMGLGIAAMHYTGMAAMEVAPPIRYNITLFLISILIAIGASVVALSLAFRLRSNLMRHVFWKRLGGAVVMGAGIAGMHYSGMAAAQFAPDTICTATTQTVDQYWLAIAIAVSCVMFLGATMLVLTIDVRLAQELTTAHAQIAEMARTDPLTGLANRRSFLDRLEDAFRARKRHGPSLAVLYLDLDHFKEINDTLGHPMGDALLVEVASRLKDNVRLTDLVARFGGDEFAILQMNTADAAASDTLAAKLNLALAQPYTIDGHKLLVTVSIGIAPASTDAAKPDDLMNQADLALYRAKGEGRNCHRFHTSDLDRVIQTRLRLEQELRLAIERDELELLFQPQIDIRSGELIGLASQLRWNHPHRGKLFPEAFIPIAERSGVIVAIGTWIFEGVCRQLCQWRDLGIAPPLVAVHISSGQLKASSDLAPTLNEYLQKWNIAAGSIELELKESVLGQLVEAQGRVLSQLHQFGFQIAIDDFGLGYSCLSELAKSPVNRLRLADQLVRSAVGNGRSAGLVRAVVVLARELGISVIADGVETRAQSEFLLAAGCHLAQGPLYGAPMSGSEATRLLQSAALKSNSLRGPEFSVA